jgi:hypothetical protein
MHAKRLSEFINLDTIWVLISNNYFESTGLAAIFVLAKTKTLFSFLIVDAQ